VQREWRTKIINGLLVILALAALPAWIMTIITGTQTAELRWLPTLLSFAFVMLVALAVLRKIDYRVRAWGVLLVGYFAAIANLALSGLRGAGPWYLLVLPILGFIMVSVRSGILAAILSTLTLTVIMVLSERGILIARGDVTINPWSSYSTFLMLLATITTLLTLFHRFQVNLIEKELKAQDGLMRAKKSLEQQKRNLEIKVRERTQELLQSNKIQTALYKITDAASTAHDMQEFYVRIHRTISELMYAGNLFIALYDEISGLLSFPYVVDEKDSPPPTQPLKDFHGMVSYVIRTGKSIKHGEDQRKLLEKHEVEAIGTTNVDGIGAPLKADNKILGTIFVQSYTKGIHYTDQDDEVLAFVAQHIATALTRLRALEAERQRTAELAILNSVSEAMSKTLDLTTVTRIVGDKIRDIFKTDTIYISLYDPQTNLIHTPYEYDKNEGGYIDYLEPFPLGKGLSSKIITTKQPLLFGTLQEQIDHEAYFPPEVVEQSSVGMVSQSWIGVPILWSDQVLGLIALADNPPHAFNENHLRLLQTLSANIGVAITNARLFQDEQQRSAELTTINTVSSALVSELDLNA